MARAGLLVLLTALLAVSQVAARPFTADDLVSLRRASDPQPSPDGEQVAFVVRETDLEAGKGTYDLWLVATDGRAAPRRLTSHPAADRHPRWSADGRSLFFLSTRSGSQQVWRLPLGGGEAMPVTDLPVDVDNLVVSPDGERLAFTAEVYPDCADLACTADRLAAAAKTTGQLYDRLFVRHWDTWKDGRRSHLFTLPASGAGTPRDVSAALDADVPAKPFGGAEEIAFTPDSRGLVFAARVAGAGEPWSTDFDLYLVPVDGAAEPRLLTDNPAWDTAPAFSSDGAHLAWLSMERPGYESDRRRIMIRAWPDGEPREVAPGWDRSAGGIVFSADGETIYTTAGDVGNVGLFAAEVASGEVTKLVGSGHVRSPGVAGSSLVYGLDDLRSPVDLYAMPIAGGEARPLTSINGAALGEVDFGEYEQFSFAGWNGEIVYGYLVRPVGFEAGKRYPLAFLIHGGPQGSFDNDFHYRWNPQVYAGAGYAAVMIDFHGSTGYGQAFTDSIRDDWGGKPLEDLQKGLAHVLERYPWIDGDRACALGASYGGYMINWIAGRWPDAFRCLVNHDGLFDTRSMYYSTEELWFPEWEFRGTPWENPEAYERNNPAAFVEHWQAPMLVIHGALDYRVDPSQGLQTFTALQRRGIPSRLLFYPDENHWVLAPHNSLQWHETVLDWLARWTAEGAGDP